MSLCHVFVLDVPDWGLLVIYPFNINETLFLAFYASDHI